MIGLIVVITMLAMAVPVTAQNRFIELDPEEGTIGSKVNVVGEGFNESTDTTDKYAVMYFSSQEASSVDDIDSDVTVYEIVKDGIWLDEDGAFDVVWLGRYWLFAFSISSQNSWHSGEPSLRYIFSRPELMAASRSKPSSDFERWLKVKGMTRDPSACLRNELTGSPTPVASTTIRRHHHTFFRISTSWG